MLSLIQKCLPVRRGNVLPSKKIGTSFFYGRGIFATRYFSIGAFTEDDNFSVDPSSVRINTLHSGVFLQPHPAKIAKGGEDAASITQNVVAVADGVGGWAESGVDPAKYSRSLCANIDSLVKKDLTRPIEVSHYESDPRQLLVDAVADTRETGSCTCVVALLEREEPRLHTCNLGDSGYLLLRKSGLDVVSIFRSKEQTHGFNFPYQVGTGGDDPASADV